METQRYFTKVGKSGSKKYIHCLTYSDWNSIIMQDERSISAGKFADSHDLPLSMHRTAFELGRKEGFVVELAFVL